MSNIRVLKKLEFDDLPQFLENLNSNFAIIQNSPLFKGVLGDSGEDGLEGKRGERGSRFLFVNVEEFTRIFGAEISKGSDVDITFLNNKLVNFNTKKLLLEAFGVTELVDKDVVVLTDSVMLVYSSDDNIFEETGQAFNPENNFINNIEQTIEQIVKKEIENNPVIKNATNVFDYYVTLAKNYADDNTTLVTDKMLDTSVYSPYIPNYNNKVGIEIKDHNYYGYTDERFPITHSGTMIFGSIKRYYQMLMKTIAVDGDNSLTSDYAVGVNNIPSLILLQDTYNNGLMLGYKSKENLKSFGSIYKNDQNELVFKSDSSKKANEFSELKLHKNYLKYDKPVNFSDTLTVGKNFELLGNINNSLIKTGIYTASKNLNNIEIGSVSGDTFLQSNKIILSKYNDYILATNASGEIIRQYKVEKKAVPTVVNLNQYGTDIPNSTNNFLTSNYFDIIAKRINSLASYVNTNYWLKSQFNTGDIKDLTLGNNLVVKNNTNLADLLNINKSTSTITLSGTTTNIDSTNIKLSRFKNIILVTDANGNIITTYVIATKTFNPSINTTTGAVANNNLFETVELNNVLTARYYNTIVTLFNTQNKFIVDNYWRKTQFTDGSLTTLRVKDSITIDNPNLKVGSVFTITSALTTINNNAILNGDVTISKIKSRVLVTDSTGKIIATYVVDNSTSSSTLTEKTNAKNSEKYQDITINLTNNALGGTDRLTTLALVKTVVKNIQDVIAWVGNNFWRKDQFSSGEIANIKTTSSLTTDGNFNAGSASNRNISTSGVNTTLGTTSGKITNRGNINFANYVNGFLSTNSSGDLAVTYKMGTTYPKVSPTNGTAGVTNGGVFNKTNIQKDYWTDLTVWVDGSATVKGIYGQDFSTNNVLNGKHFQWIFYQFSSIATKLKSYYTKTEIDNKLKDLMPVGAVIDFFGAYKDIPKGWSICDGRTLTVTGGTFKTPDLINKYRKGINGETYTGGGSTIGGRLCGDIDGGTLTLTQSNLPKVIMTGTTNFAGEHQHDYQDSYRLDVARNNGVAVNGSSRVYVTTDNGRLRYQRDSGWTGEPTVYWRINKTLFSGGHSHIINNITLNPNAQTSITINPKSFGVYPIIKYTL